MSIDKIDEISLLYLLRYWAALKDSEYDNVDIKLRNQFARLFHQFQNVYDGTDTWYLSSCHGEFEDEPGPGENLIWNTNSRGYATVLDLLQVKQTSNTNQLKMF